MKEKPTRKAGSKPLTLKQRAEIEELVDLPDERIDTGEIPEAADWSDARRGVFYRPVKQQLTLRLDADVVAWFRKHARGGRGYQTDINRTLRDFVVRQENKAKQGPR